MARICIVTPGQLGSNPRVVKEAEALCSAGHSVQVIASKVAAFVEPRDQAVMSCARFAIERVPFDNRLRWRTSRAWQILARQAFAFAPTTRLAGIAQSALLPRLAAATRRVRADLYVGHYVTGLYAAAQAARENGGLYAFDAEDFHLGDLSDAPEHAFEKRLIRAVEARYLPGAAYITAASPGIAEAYEAEYGTQTPRVVLNAFPKSLAPEAPESARQPLDRPSVYWFSQTIGPDRGLECAVIAIARARSRPHLHLRGTLAAGFGDILKALAARFSATDRLHLHEPGAPDEMVRLAGKYDVGLVSETGSTQNRRIALTNKQFTYLLAGLPIVMSDVPAHVRFAAEAPDASFLYRAEDPEALASVLDRLLLDPANLTSARRQAYALGQSTFNWERESGRLLDAMQSVLVSAGAKAA